MRFVNRKMGVVAAAGAATVGLLLSSVGAASAATDTTFPNADYGFDGNANLIVGGGSTTLFYMAQQLASLWDDTASCSTNNSNYNATTTNGTQTYPQPTSQSTVNGTSVGPAFNQCTGSSQTYSGGGNYDGDTVAIATPVGSSTGIASLNGFGNNGGGTFAYEGTNQNIPTTGDPNSTNGYSNGYGTVDFAMSSRAAKTAGGNCTGGNELAASCDTFWGVASDGVEIFTFDQSAGAYNSGSGGFSAQDIWEIYTGGYTTWGQLPEWKAETASYESANSGATSDPNLPASQAPIVPYSMNKTSGTFADFDNWVINNANSSDPGLSGFTANTTYARELAGNSYPLENDVKPLIVDAQNNAYTSPSGTTYPAGATTTDPMSAQNPVNWIWFGSYGLLNRFSYLAGGTVDGFTFSTGAVPIASSSSTANGILPSANAISSGKYPIPRTLSFVTKSSDATCPTVTSGTNVTCNFSGGPTITGTGTSPVQDINVTGASSGKGGAVREFMRFLCRPTSSTANAIDPYTGASLGSEIQASISNSGFESIPVASRSSGSSCNVNP